VIYSIGSSVWTAIASNAGSDASWMGSASRPATVKALRGVQRRLADAHRLAKVLVRRPECVLLDEPTNHLDTASRDWLAEDLITHRWTVLIVTHDGAFRTSRVASWSCGNGHREHGGNYSDYQRQKAARLQQQDREAGRQERQLARQQRFIDRFARRRARPPSSRAAKALAKIERVERPRRESEVHIALSADGRTGTTFCNGGH
jgi:ATP-binding cassette subfamily F protein 3